MTPLARSILMWSGPIIGLSGYYWLNLGHFVLFWIGVALAAIHLIYKHGNGPLAFGLVPIAVITISFYVFPLGETLGISALLWVFCSTQVWKPLSSRKIDVVENIIALVLQRYEEKKP